MSSRIARSDSAASPQLLRCTSDLLSALRGPQQARTQPSRPCYFARRAALVQWTQSVRTSKLQGLAKRAPSPQPRTAGPSSPPAKARTARPKGPSLTPISLSAVLRSQPQLFDRTKVSAVERYVTRIDILPERYHTAQVRSDAVPPIAHRAEWHYTLPHRSCAVAKLRMPHTTPASAQNDTTPCHAEAAQYVQMSRARLLMCL